MPCCLSFGENRSEWELEDSSTSWRTFNFTNLWLSKPYPTVGARKDQEMSFWLAPKVTLQVSLNLKKADFRFSQTWSMESYYWTESICIYLGQSRIKHCRTLELNHWVAGFEDSVVLDNRCTECALQRVLAQTTKRHLIVSSHIKTNDVLPLIAVQVTYR